MNQKKSEMTVIDIGDSVVCDSCNADYTNSDEKGGFMFSSSSFCPRCAPEMMKSITLYNEERYITDYAKDGETFKDFCLRMRGGNNTITITSF